MGGASMGDADRRLTDIEGGDAFGQIRARQERASLVGEPLLALAEADGALLAGPGVQPTRGGEDAEDSDDHQQDRDSTHTRPRSRR